MSLRTPLGRVRGLGSAKEGVRHWWVQRLTAIALVPLSIWFVVAVIGLAGADHATLKAWLSNPGNATMMILFVYAGFHHTLLGVQVVVEDYVHSETTKMATLIALRMAVWLLGVFTVVAVLKVAFGG